ncbi:MAG: aminotransferase class V-fold PLP-dependent enzyme [Burkholderiales bacterium]|nr:aminotransferase class V-fold PLP-dependent enzyme [Burkholderiales bacterium]
MTAVNWLQLRGEFPALANWTYLDTARKTVPPRCQELAMQEYWRDISETAGVEAWSAANVAETRVAMARLLGAKPAEIAFTKNTTEGLNIAAHAFALQPGDNIVLTDMEHVANVWVWKHWEQRGVEIRYAKNRDGRLPLAAFLEKMDDRTRVVSTAFITYGNGFRVNLPELGAACRAQGARLVVDGVQAAGVLAAPLNGLGADIIAIGGHKNLLGLTGLGLLYCREELIDEIRTPFLKAPAATGSPQASAHLNSQFDYVRTAHRFEGGNPNFLGLKVLRESARFIESIGLQNIENRVRELSTYCMAQLKAAGLPVLTPAPWAERAQIVSFAAPEAGGLMDVLREKHRVIVNVKDGAIRISMSFFNNEADIDCLLTAIRQELACSA